MTPKDKALIRAYLQQSLENFELTAGRIVLDSGSETIRAGKNEDEESKQAARAFLRRFIDQNKDLICGKYKEQLEKLGNDSENILDLIGHISTLIASSGFDTSGLSYIFIATWLFKNGLSKICQDVKEKSQ